MTTTTRAIGAGLAAAAIAVLAGCTAQAPEPSPSPTGPTVAGCALADTDVTWDHLREWQKKEVGHRFVTVGADGTQVFDDEHVRYTSSVTVGDGLKGVDKSDLLPFLMQSFARTGQSASDSIGNPSANFDSVAVNDPPEGVFVIGYQVSQFVASFSVSCGREDVGTGELISSEGDEIGGTFVGCGPPDAPATSDYGRSLQDYCPPA